MRVLVTGATGFAGAAVVRALEAAGHDVGAGVRAASRERFSFTRPILMPDLSQPFDAAALVAGFDAVVHLAGLAHSSRAIPEATYDAVNAEATRRLACASAEAGVGKFILVSSVRAQTGPCATRILTELDEPEPTDAYGRSKLKAERLAASVLAGSQTGLVILRPVLMYGPTAKGNMAALLRLARSPWPLPVGGFTARRSLLGLTSFASAVAHALVAPSLAGGIYLVADEEALDVAGIIAALRAGLERVPGIVEIPLHGVPAALRALGRADIAGRLFGDLVVSPASLRRTGWKPTCSAREGLMALTRSGCLGWGELAQSN